MNPALHVAQFAAALAAARNSHQMTGAVQECFMGTMPTWATILALLIVVILLIIAGIGIYYSCAMGVYVGEFNGKYWSMRLNQISKTLKK